MLLNRGDRVFLSYCAAQSLVVAAIALPGGTSLSPDAERSAAYLAAGALLTALGSSLGWWLSFIGAASAATASIAFFISSGYQSDRALAAVAAGFALAFICSSPLSRFRRGPYYAVLPPRHTSTAGDAK